jgi:hypothetical protein
MLAIPLLCLLSDCAGLVHLESETTLKSSVNAAEAVAGDAVEGPQRRFFVKRVAVWCSLNCFICNRDE